jgi:L-asparaginase
MRGAQLRRHLRAVCEEVAEYLKTHSAVESVLQAVARLEDDQLFNAGTGSVLQQDGRARMSAAVMDGTRLRLAGVLNIEDVQHPVRVAEALLDTDDRILAGREATRFARTLGVPLWNSVTAARRRQWRQLREEHGTIGAVALDGDGGLAAATSSGGKPLARAGRVSDSGLPAGTYATDRAAISCTGLGEDIVDECLAVRLSQRVTDGLPLARAFTVTFRELQARRRRVAAISIDRHGRFHWASTLPVLFAVGRVAGRRVESF